MTKYMLESHPIYKHFGAEVSNKMKLNSGEMKILENYITTHTPIHPKFEGRVNEGKSNSAKPAKAFFIIYIMSIFLSSSFT